jgi:glycosyltransferase involved in cell wall biosynthesis
MRIVFLAPTIPFPPDNGGKARAAAVALSLAARHDVVLAAFAEPGVPASSVADVAHRFRELKVFPRPARATRRRRWLSASPSDVHQLSSPEMAAWVAETVARFQPDVLLTGDPALTPYVRAYDDRVRVLDYVCVPTLQFERMKAMAPPAERLLWSFRTLKFAAFLRRAARHYDLCVVNSEEDRQALLAASPGWARVEVVPNGLDLASYPLDLARPEPNTLVFHGALNYGPNLDAVRFLVADILPRVRSAIPEARLLVTGRKPPNGSAPQGDGVVYTGYVPDIRPVIAGAWACPVALRTGAGGARFKVLEALALGTPVISTAIGYEGLAVTDGVDVLRAEDPDAFAAQTVRVLQSPALRARLAEGGRRLIEREYDWAVLGARLAGKLTDLVSSRTVGTSATAGAREAR